MRQLHPTASDEIDPLEVYGAVTRAPVDGRPWVMANMVASADGATAVDGVSGAVGGDGDREVFTALRTIADVVLVASGTATAERYGPARVDDRRTEWRAARGRPPTPRIACVTGSLRLDPALPLFADRPRPAPLVLTVASAPADRRATLEPWAEIVEVGEESVDLGEALALLGRHGAEIVLAEGGPGLLGQLVEADLIDELCLTLSPMLAGGDSRRIVHGASGQVRQLSLAHVLEQDGELYLRYQRRRSG